MTPDTATGHPVPVTPDTPDPVAAALSALASHRENCAACGDVLPCTKRRELTAAWRKALRECGQITTTPASG